MSWEATHSRGGGPLESRAAFLDLTRRVELLEKGLYGKLAPEMSMVVMVRCYRDAHRALERINAENAGLWLAQAYVWDARGFVALGRVIADPYPFRPLLSVLDKCVLQSIPGAREAQARLESVAQDVLTAQGLELIHPRDVMHSLRLLEVLAEMKAR